MNILALKIKLSDIILLRYDLICARQSLYQENAEYKKYYWTKDSKPNVEAMLSDFTMKIDKCNRDIKLLCEGIKSL